MKPFQIKSFLIKIYKNKQKYLHTYKTRLMKTHKKNGNLERKRVKFFMQPLLYVKGNVLLYKHIQSHIWFYLHIPIRKRMYTLNT